VSSAFSTPSFATFSVFGVPLTSKAFSALAAAHLVLSRGAASLAAGLLGLLFGLAFQFNLAGVATICRVPRPIGEACRVTVGRVLEGPDAWKTQVRWGRYVQDTSQGQHQPQQGGGGAGAGAGMAERFMAPEADPEALQTLQSMGFDTFRATQALRQTNNDVNLAMNLLLDH